MGSCDAEGSAPVKKPTGFVASDQRLLQPFERFVCDGQHDHESLCGSALQKLQVWPWMFAQAAADGIEELLKTKYSSKMVAAYPTASTNTGQKHARANPGDKSIGK